MGHAVFIALHLIALFLGGWPLLLTVALHLIYGILRRQHTRGDPNAPHPNTHRRCPDCREIVRADANKCVHCGTRLQPQSTAPTKAERSFADAQGFVLAKRAETPPAASAD